MKKSIIIAIASLLTCVGVVTGQNHLNLDLVSNVKFDERSSDIWGYVDSNGIEYAIIGTHSHTRILSLEDPANPIERIAIPGATSIWRDIKSYKDHIYVVADVGEDGLLVIDMNNAPADITYSFYKPEIPLNGGTLLDKCHNLYIDTDEGNVYLSGCNSKHRALIFDLDKDPKQPPLVGVDSTTYSHDLYVKNGKMYSADLYRGELSINDVSDVSNPKQLASVETSREFTHNVWVSDDERYAFTTDEKPNAFVDVYDISDLEDIKRVNMYRPKADKDRGTIPHNTHYMDGLIVTSWYTDGVIVMDASEPDNLVEVARYDSWPGNDGGFHGCWGAYPYLPSGLLLISDIETGLYVLQPKSPEGELEYPKASHYAGVVVDNSFGTRVAGATVEIVNPDGKTVSTDANGIFKTGYFTDLNVVFKVSHPSYDDVYFTPKSNEFNLIMIGEVITDYTILDRDKNPIPNVQVKVNYVDNYFPPTYLETDENGKVNVERRLNQGEFIYATKWGYNMVLDSTNAATDTLYLDAAYQDFFEMDLGWSTSSDASSGDWARDSLLEYTTLGGSVLVPAGDSDDEGSNCYTTGLDGSSFGSNDVDNGSVLLSSPSMNFLGYDYARVRYSYHLSILENSFPRDDYMRVYLTNGADTILLREEVESVDEWQEVFDVVSQSDIAFTDDMHCIFEVVDQGESHYVNAYLDKFSVDLSNDDLSTSKDVENVDLTVYPNPFDNRLVLKSDVEMKEIVVMDIHGKVVHRGHPVELYTELELDVPNGVYFIKVVTVRGSVLCKKIVKI